MNNLRNIYLNIWKIVFCLIALLLCACGANANAPLVTRIPKGSLPKFEAHGQVKTTFIESVRSHDISILRPIMGDAAEKQMEEWLQQNAPKDCDYVMREYQSSAAGGSKNTPSEIEKADVVTYDVFDVMIPCASEESGRYTGFYYLEIYDVKFEYTAEGWQVTEWGSIAEYIK